MSLPQLELMFRHVAVNVTFVVSSITIFAKSIPSASLVCSAFIADDWQAGDFLKHSQ